MDAVVVGYIAGDKANCGRIGSLRVRMDNGIEFNIGGGLTKRDRALNKSCWSVREKTLLPPEYEGIFYPKGTVIEFSYRKLSNDGVPCEARILRKKSYA